ncbi:MAG: patatin-like phospholipase family protein [Gemmatimonadetes bacterium]|nr:patatin-like phospholipase family protein [Gemmatimonadota bacterium]
MRTAEAPLSASQGARPALGLVLTGGGARAAYQVGALAYVAERCPGLSFPILTGVSAGAINATFLAGFRGSLAAASRELGSAWKRLTVDRVFHSDTFSLLLSALRWAMAMVSAGAPVVSRVRSLVDTTPLREFLGETIDLDGIDANITAGRLRALALTTTSYTTGQTVTFVQGAPDVPTWERVMRRGVRDRITVDHVMASAAVPLVFPAVRVDEEYYGDGAVRQGAPLAPAVHLGADRILALAVRYVPPEGRVLRKFVGEPPPAQVMAHLLHSVFLDSLDADAERLDRINELLDRVPADARPPDRLRRIELLVIRPSQDIGAIAMELAETIPANVRLLLRGLGAHRARNADFLSYFMFGEPFVGRLIDLGYEDAARNWPALARFLCVPEE